MTDNTTRRERLNLRALRVSLRSALGTLPASKLPHAQERANLLLNEARQRATDPGILAEIEELQAVERRRLVGERRGPLASVPLAVVADTPVATAAC